MDPEPPRTSMNSSMSIFPFSRLCKRRSVAVSASAKEFRNPNNHSSSNEAVDGSDDNKPQMTHKLFDAITALKYAYVQLQQAHLPYTPKKIKLADEVVVSVLQALSDLEETYRSRSSLSLEIHRHEDLLAQLRSKLRIKDLEMRRLRCENEKLDAENAALEKAVKQKLLPKKIFHLNQEMSPALFLNVFNLAAKSIHEFAKPLISLMKASGWDLDLAARSLYSSVAFAERSHKKYAFEAYLSQVMLDPAPLEDERFSLDQLDGVMNSQDPFDYLIADPDSQFGRFCRSKYALAVPSKMEDSFFGNLDQRSFVLSGRHPRTPFYQAFVAMSRWAWALQVMANSFVPKAEMFYAKNGQEFTREYMEDVVGGLVSNRGMKHVVGFTVTPGFRMASTIVPCRVYSYRMKVLHEQFQT
ncbi:protein GRAVITROPIC IN THE LIGHT 1-like [Zingiber officinale]|uniref:DUF641 domain-containing protein n=1 Tax=Zingiber officinale TaxID=94328 RepID=A0A8J5I8D4_ZINOF|nr:protein GRAVITROPIC IN THE LIGHT 1-like [Zingiber officinale]KAG6535540.1 hypothetical protein ZIOFF_000562 [Zingiber officinale]